MKALVDRFLTWDLPSEVCVDACTTLADYPYPRTGTNLLTASQAEQMLEHVVGPTLQENDTEIAQLRKLRDVAVEYFELISMRKEGFEEDSYRCIDLADEALAQIREGMKK